MPKKFLKRYMPDHNKIRNHKQLNRLFGTLLHDPNLLHLNRRSVSGAFAVGLFFAFVPLPTQMIMAAGVAILFRVNLPLSVGLVWLTNPLTIPPMFYFCYKLGTWILGTPLLDIEFQLSWEWLATEMTHIWQPFLLGCAVAGTVSAILGWVGIRLIWRCHVAHHLKRRKAARAAREKS
jgi:uncharacterized protein (DUF2062 family)